MDGYRMYVNLGEPQGIQSYFFKEPGTYWLTPDLIHPGDFCVDAGANAGIYTFLCASIVAPTGRVFAFEPNPKFADMIRRSKALNAFGDIVQVEQRALYSVSGEKQRFFLSVNPMNTGTSSLSEKGLFLSPDNAIDVTTVAFDDFANDNKIERFRFVKIDVELVEEFVIAGAAAVLGAHRIDYMILETFAGGRAQELMLKAGYRGFLLVQSQRKLIPIADVAAGPFRGLSVRESASAGALMRLAHQVTRVSVSTRGEAWRAHAASSGPNGKITDQVPHNEEIRQCDCPAGHDPRRERSATAPVIARADFLRGTIRRAVRPRRTTGRPEAMIR